MQFAHAAVDRGQVQSALRIAVRAEVLQHGRDAVVQVATALLAGEEAVEERIFAVTFFHASPPQVPYHVDARCQHLADALVVQVVRGGFGTLVGQGRMEGGPQRNVLREDGRAFMHGAMQGLGHGEYGYAQPGMVHHVFLDAAHVAVAAFARQGETFDEAPTEVADKAAQLVFVQLLTVEEVPGVDMADLGDFLFQRHAGQQVVRTLFGCEARVFIGLGERQDRQEGQQRGQANIKRSVYGHRGEFTVS